MVLVIFSYYVYETYNVYKPALTLHFCIKVLSQHIT